MAKPSAKSVASRRHLAGQEAAANSQRERVGVQGLRTLGGEISPTSKKQGLRHWAHPHRTRGLRGGGDRQEIHSQYHPGSELNKPNSDPP